MTQRFSPATFFVCGGLLIWAADFLFTYIFQAVACARGFAQASIAGLSVVPLASGTASVLALAATGALFMSARRRMKRGTVVAVSSFLDWLALTLAGLAIVAIVWLGLPALVLRRVCA